jgi:multidrug efflux pump subunit AcrA (membrane-fusion protein)
MFLRAGIITETVSVLTIPLNAVLPKTDGTGIVYILENQKVKSREVEIGEILPQAKIEIKNGLHRADVVVVEGAAYLREGDRVRVL